MTNTPLRTVRETAELLGVGETTVWELIRNGELISVKIPSGRGEGRRFMRRIEESEIQAFIERSRVAEPTRTP